jgi:hypothetical protein
MNGADMFTDTLPVEVRRRWPAVQGFGRAASLSKKTFCVDTVCLWGRKHDANLFDDANQQNDADDG